MFKSIRINNLKTCLYNFKQICGVYPLDFKGIHAYYYGQDKLKSTWESTKYNDPQKLDHPKAKI
jgi:hypothetical protein